MTLLSGAGQIVDMPGVIRAINDLQIAVANLEGGGLILETAGRTLRLSDIKGTIIYNSASSGNFEIPPDNAVAWPANAVIAVFTMGVGLPAFTEGTSGGVTVTLDEGASVAVAEQFGTIAIMRVGANEWALI